LGHDSVSRRDKRGRVWVEIMLKQRDTSAIRPRHADDDVKARSTPWVDVMPLGNERGGERAKISPITTDHQAHVEAARVRRPFHPMWAMPRRQLVFGLVWWQKELKSSPLIVA